MDYKLVQDYSVAPYNFVSLPSRCICPYEEYKDLPKQNVLDDSYLNGYIEYDFHNETPLIVGANEKSEDGCITPIKIDDKKYIIPGNTIRGVIRNNASILSLSSVSNLIDDSRFYFRSFGKGKNKDEYVDKLDIGQKQIGEDNVSMPKRINGGYIYKDSKDKFVLIPSKKINNNGLSYFIITEPYLRLMNPDVKINYMYSDKILDLIYHKEQYKSIDKKTNPNKARLLRQSQVEGHGKKYVPYCTKISFEIKGPRIVSKIGKPEQYNNNGYLMTSKFISGKLAHYIIPEPDYDNPMKIEMTRDNSNFEFIDFYNDDLLRTKKKKAPNKSDKNDETYFFLPQETGMEKGKPIFYGEYKNKIYFGFSPYLRIPYDYSIKDLIPENYKNYTGISYVDALFGFTERGNDKNNYKSRLSFEDAVCTDENPIEDKKYSLVTGEPHASAYALYLEQKIDYKPKEIKNYNNEDSKIRGIKQYLNKNYIEEAESSNKNMTVTVKPLSPKTNFRGRIYFKNIKRDELGLIAWALKVKEDAFENIGYGKPYGFGRIRINNIKIKTEDTDKKYSSMNVDYFIEENRQMLIDEYKRNFLKRFKIDLDNQISIKDFIILKTLVIDEKHKNDARYMRISFQWPEDKTNEFNKLLPLPNPDELKRIIDGKMTFNRNNYNNNDYRTGNHYKANNRKQGHKGSDYSKYNNNTNINNSLAELLKNVKIDS